MIETLRQFSPGTAAKFFVSASAVIHVHFLVSDSDMDMIRIESNLDRKIRKGATENEKKKQMPDCICNCGGCMCGWTGRLQGDSDESAVVDKSDGISEAAEAEPLAEGETRIIEVPERWEQTEKWNKDRWIFRADVELESVEAGNLPVVN